jgi:hypothetical protein
MQHDQTRRISPLPGPSPPRLPGASATAPNADRVLLLGTDRRAEDECGGGALQVAVGQRSSRVLSGPPYRSILDVSDLAFGQWRGMAWSIHEIWRRLC